MTLNRLTLEKELQRVFSKITRLNDFEVRVKYEYNKENYGEYLIHEGIIVLYVLDEYYREYPKDIIVREGLHELAHHLQYHHTKRYKPTKRTIHGYVFRRQFAKVLKKYYNGIVPRETLDYLKRGGYLSEALCTQILAQA